MSFLYPLFLIASLSLAIPILIHLFNLRKQKTIYFSNVKLIQKLNILTKRQSKIKYKWLLVLRLLLLIFLILAFAQPFFSNKNSNLNSSITSIYVDNSQSMSLHNNQKTLLDIAKENAINIINSKPGPFIIITNDRTKNFKTQSKSLAKEIIANINISHFNKNNTQIFNEINVLLQSESIQKASLYYISDFQKSQFNTQLNKKLLNNIDLHYFKINQGDWTNYTIDTAYFEHPVFQTSKPNKLIVTTKLQGEKTKDEPILQVFIDDKVISATQLKFQNKDKSIDTFLIQTDRQGWQKLLLSISDRQYSYDDSFILAIHNNTKLNISLLNSGTPNVYIQAALRANDAYEVNNVNELNNTNLIILSDVQKLNEELVNKLKLLLEQGHNVYITLSNKLDIAGFNKEIKKLVDINIKGIDTTPQFVTNIQGQHPIFKDMFENIAENAKLPFINFYYKIESSINALQQPILSFRNGSPLLASYTLSNSNLYILASPLLPLYGDFVTGQLFAPLLFQMANQNNGERVSAFETDNPATFYINQKANEKVGLIHIKGNGYDIIPPQKGSGLGTLVDLPNLPFGYYEVAALNNNPQMIAVNNNRNEANLISWSLDDLKQNFNGMNIDFKEISTKQSILTLNQQSSLPLWKICIILALVVLIIETIMLTKSNIKIKSVTL